MPETAVDALDEAEAAAELTRLADEIAAHDLRYYQDEAPTVSDAEYDALKQRNAALEARFPALVRENSPSLRVGAARARTAAACTIAGIWRNCWRSCRRRVSTWIN